MKSFTIRCNSCGTEMTIEPGDRDRESEKIEFGQNKFEEEFISCSCGNRIVATDVWEEELDEYVERWVSIPKGEESE